MYPAHMAQQSRNKINVFHCLVGYAPGYRGEMPPPFMGYGQSNEQQSDGSHDDSNREGARSNEESEHVEEQVEVDVSKI